MADKESSMAIMDYERTPLNDNMLLWIFQNKLFNAMMDYNSDKFVYGVMFLDAHLEPYKDKWKDYDDQLTALRERWMLGKNAARTDKDKGDIDYRMAMEWYRLQRTLIKKAGIIQKGSIMVDI